MNVYDAIVNLNTVLIVLGTGLLVWIVRQILPDPIEEAKLWKTLLRVLPIGIGMGLAMIPGLKPAEVVAHNLIIGGVAGSLAANLYGLMMKILGERVKAFLGSAASRKKAPNGG
jgi:hypothetical protein